MATTQKTTFSCDIGCGAHASTSHHLPKGWIVVGVEDDGQERMFVDKHVCPTCRDKIMKAKPGLTPDRI